MKISIFCFSLVTIIVYGKHHSSKLSEINKLRDGIRKYDKYGAKLGYYNSDNVYDYWAPFELVNAEDSLRTGVKFNREVDVPRADWQELVEDDFGGTAHWAMHHIVGITPPIAFWNRAIKNGHTKHLKWAAYGLYQTLHIQHMKVYDIENEAEVKAFLRQFITDCDNNDFTASTQLWSANVKKGLSYMLAWLPGNIFLGPSSNQRDDDPGSSFEIHAGEIINLRSDYHYNIKWPFYLKFDYLLLLYKKSPTPDLCSLIARYIGIMAINHYYTYNKMDWVQGSGGKVRLAFLKNEKVRNWDKSEFVHLDEIKQKLQEEELQDIRSRESKRKQELVAARNAQRLKQQQAQAGVKETCYNECNPPIAKCGSGNKGAKQNCQCNSKCSGQGGVCNSYIETIKHRYDTNAVKLDQFDEKVLGAVCPMKKFIFKCVFKVVCA